jgi:dihydroneopterin aldolase
MSTDDQESRLIHTGYCWYNGYEVNQKNVSSILPSGSFTPGLEGQTFMDESDLILINGLEFYGYHGASEQEQTVGHRYCVDVRLSVDTRPAASSDRLSDTVSYSRVAKRIVEVGTLEQYRLLEALAEHLTTLIFTEFPPVLAVQIRVQKICPPMNAIVSSVGVEITRRRKLETDESM